MRFTMESSQKDMLIGAVIGFVAGGSVVAFAKRSPKSPSAMLPSGAVSALERQMVDHASLVTAALQWANQAEEKRISLGAGAEILTAFRETDGSIPRVIRQWVQQQMARWTAEGGLAWAERQVQRGVRPNHLAYLWIMEVMGHGVGLWEEFKGYPKPAHSEPPYHTFRKFPRR